MEVIYENETYDFDFDEITVQQAKTIKSQCGMTLKGLEDGLGEGDADSLRALFWLMMVNSGIKADINTVDFKIVKFSKAVQDAAEKERKVLEEADKVAALAGVASRKHKVNPKTTAESNG